MALRTRTPWARALLPATRCQSSGPLGALLSSPALGVRLPTALQVLQVRREFNDVHGDAPSPLAFAKSCKGGDVSVLDPALAWDVRFISFFLSSGTYFKTR